MDIDQVEIDNAKQAALGRLSYSALTVKKLQEYLQKKGYRAEVCECVINRLLEIKLLDDEIYATEIVRACKASNKYSRREVYRKLVNKGVDTEIAVQVLEKFDRDSEETAALKLALKKGKATLGCDTQTRRNKILGALYRKGFCVNDYREKLEAVFEELDALSLDLAESP